MPACTFIIRGDIKDFTRLDNLYASLLREAKKLLTAWSLDIDVKYSLKEGEEPQE